MIQNCFRLLPLGRKRFVEHQRIELWTFRMQSGRSPTELIPLDIIIDTKTLIEVTQKRYRLYLTYITTALY